MDAEETEMSNAADDPGHRPPPPRRGEPQQPYPNPPYHGEQQPYQAGGHLPPPPPNQPAGPWPHQGGYPAAPQDPLGASAYRLPQKKGFFSTLFDVNFDQMISVKLARTIYTIMLVLITLFALVVLWYGLSFLEWNTALGFMTILIAPLIWIFDIIFIRVFMEFVINQFKITENLKAIREQREVR